MTPLLIYGLGVSGIAAARLAQSLGHKLYLWDDFKQSADLPHDLQNHPQVFFLKPALTAPLLNRTILESQIPPSERPHLKLIASPGIPELTLTYQELLKFTHYQTLSEIDLALSQLKKPVFAITGTNGKTTCCSLIHHLFQFVGLNLGLIGNIGRSASDAALSEHSSIDCGYILELSSFQLSTITSINSSIVVFTNLTPDHLDRHGDLESYMRIKWRSIQQNSAPRTLDFPCLITTDEVLQLQQNYQLDLNGFHTITAPQNTSFDSSKLLACLATQKIARFLLRQNPSSSLRDLAGKTLEHLYTNLLSFKGLPHRYERLPHPLYLVINDSKSTNYQATQFALAKLPPKNTLLILGGIPKVQDKTHPTFLQLPDHIQLVLIFGHHTNIIKSHLHFFPSHTHHPRSSESDQHPQFSSLRPPSKAPDKHHSVLTRRGVL